MERAVGELYERGTSAFVRSVNNCGGLDIYCWFKWDFGWLWLGRWLKWKWRLLHLGAG